MKHILRKLHIGGGSVVNEHQQQQQQQQQNRINESSSSNSNSKSNNSSTPSESLPSSYTISATSTFPSSTEEVRVHGESDQSPVDYNFFEEEFQVQLALAISASDTQVKEDRESAQIKVAKEISLGFPSLGSNRETLAKDVSLRYWNYSVVDYGERLLDGFYDVCGITSDSLMQGKMPLLVDLLETTVSDNIEYEVILVDRPIDRALQQLENSAYSLVQECHASELGPISSGFVRKLADLVVDRMGGPVHDTEEMLTRWKVRSYELQTSLNTIVLPLGCLDVGLSRHRALLFKVLADRINLPCRLVKGSYYTGTDEGAVNLIKIDYEGEYIIDLMGAPGVLIPAEIPSNNFQNFGVDLMGSLPIKKTAQDLCLALDKVNHESDMRIGSSTGNSHAFDAGESDRSGSNDASALGIQMKENNENHAKKNQTERFEYDFGRLFPSLQRSNEGTSGSSVKNSPAQKVQVKDVSNCVISAAQNPEFAQKLHTVLLENRAVPPELLAALAPPQDMREHNANVDSGSMNDNTHIDSSMNENTLDDDGGRQANHFFNQVLYENNDKHYPDELLKKQDVTGSANLKFHGPYSTEKTDLGRDHHVEGNTDVSSQADSCLEDHRNPMEHGAQASCSNEGRISIIENTYTNCLQEHHQGSEGSKGILARTVSGDPEMMRNPHNEWLNSMLDEVGDWEIPWEDIQIGERIGIGSYGEVYHADWNGTEVAVKRFLVQDFSGDALEQLRCEVGIMLRLRHPNVVLFMGAVTRPPNLSILTEFLPRGSLCKLLHRPNIQLDEKRRLRMALDVAKGMNYLHTSNPTIVHRDLKSPNLLVDKNWVVKVCDFGLSRLKHHTYLSSKSMAGTELQPEWMAPEVLRNEPSNEKCDVYSFGVILWELATLRLPWSGMNPMQVVGAVGFQNRHLDIPDDIDPMVAQIIRDCWHSNPDLRPSFSQLMSLLKRTKHLLVPKT